VSPAFGHAQSATTLAPSLASLMILIEIIRASDLVELSGLEPLTPCLQSTPGMSDTVADLGISALFDPSQTGSVGCRCGQDWWSVSTSAGWRCSSVGATGLLLPKPSDGVDCQRCGLPDLETKGVDWAPIRGKPQPGVPADPRPLMLLLALRFQQCRQPGTELDHIRHRFQLPWRHRHPWSPICEASHSHG